MADQRDSVARTRVENVFGDGNRPYRIPTPAWPVVTGVEGKEVTAEVSPDTLSGLNPAPNRAPEK